MAEKVTSVVATGKRETGGSLSENALFSELFVVSKKYCSQK